MWYEFCDLGKESSDTPVYWIGSEESDFFSKRERTIIIWTLTKKTAPIAVTRIVPEDMPDFLARSIDGDGLDDWFHVTNILDNRKILTTDFLVAQVWNPEDCYEEEYRCAHGYSLDSSDRDKCWNKIDCNSSIDPFFQPAFDRCYQEKYARDWFRYLEFPSKPVCIDSEYAKHLVSCWCIDHKRARYEYEGDEDCWNPECDFRSLWCCFHGWKNYGNRKLGIEYEIFVLFPVFVEQIEVDDKDKHTHDRAWIKKTTIEESMKAYDDSGYWEEQECCESLATSPEADKC